MALDKKLVSIPFSSGADTKTSDIVMEPGQLEVLENAVFEKTGRIEKRKGCSESTLGGTIDAVGSATMKGNYYLFQKSGYNYTLPKTGTSGSSLQQGKRAHFKTELFSVTSGDGHHQESPSIAVSQDGTIVGVAWTQAYWNSSTGNINYEYRISFLDADTMTPLSSDIPLSGDARADKVNRGKIKIAAQSNTVNATANHFAVYYEHANSSGDLALYKRSVYNGAIDLTNLTLFPITVIASTSVYRQTAAEASFDIVEYKQPSATTSADWNKLHVVFTEYDTSGSQHKVTYKLDNRGTLSGSVSHNQSGAMTQLVCFRSDAGGTDRFYFAFSVGTTLHLRHHNADDSSSGTIASTHALGSGLSIIQSGGFCKAYNTDAIDYVATYGTTASTRYSYVSRIQITPGSATLNVHGNPQRAHVWGVTGPMTSSESLITLMAQETRNTEDQDLNLHSILPFMNIHSTPSSAIAALGAYYNNWFKGLIGLCFRQELVRNHLNGVSPRVISSGGKHYTVLPRATNIQTFVDGSGNVSAAINSSCNVVRITTDDPVYETSRAQLASSSYLAGGGLVSNPFNWWSEVGFSQKPGLSVAETAAGSLDSSGVYSYKGVWEWVDGNGDLHRSEPSDPETLTLTSTNTGVTITCDGLSATSKSSAGSLNLVIYRTQNGGSIYNKVGTIEVENFGTDMSPTGLITHVDKVSDSNAATGAFLYTEGGELANTAAPASRYVESHRNRLFVISEDDRIWFSKEAETGFGVSFSDTLEVVMDRSYNDRPTALCSAGDELYIFKERSIWTLSGEGPSKTGVGEFYNPRKISSTAGALMGSPTLHTDSGIYFQSPRGIFRIGQQGIEYIGAPVEDLLGSQRVVGIRHHQKTETLRFALPDRILSYSYRYNSWSNHEYELAEDQSIVGIENVDDVIYVATDNDYVLIEDSSYKITNNGSTSYMPLKIRTGWISFNQIQGFGRAYRFALLGESRDKHTLTVKVYYDYDDSASVDTYTFTTSSATDAVLQFRAHLSKQKCQAVKFEIYDADNSASVGDGFAIDQITIEVGTKKGIFRTAQTTNTIGAS